MKIYGFIDKKMINNELNKIEFKTVKESSLFLDILLKHRPKFKNTSELINSLSKKRM